MVIQRIQSHWPHRLDWTNSTVDEYIADLRQQIGEEDWSQLLVILDEDSIRFPSPDGRQYFRVEGKVAPRFTLDLYGKPWGFNALLNERNIDGVWLTHPYVVGYVMDIISQNALLGFDATVNEYFRVAVDVQERQVTRQRLIELGLVLYNKFTLVYPFDLTHSLADISQCVAYIHKLTLSSAFDGFILGELSTLEYLRINIPDYEIFRASREDDVNLNVDIEIQISETIHIGVQVKSVSYRGSINDSGYRSIYQGGIVMAYYNKDGITRRRQLIQEITSEINRLC
jgi:hypothetical protein